MSAEAALHNAALGVIVSEEIVGDVRTTISYKVEGEGDDKRVLKVRRTRAFRHFVCHLLTI
jgi:hypothetical protein